jgi:hypothetical protein
MPDPTDPVKKTTRGKTVTTTATREGTNERGIKGTYTDTTNTTPVTIDTTSSNGGSDDFKAAFASASADGKDTFTFKNKSYNTKKGDSSTSNEISTTSTFKPHMLKPLPALNASGINFKKQSYEMGKTQTIQRPNEGMGAYSVSRGDSRDASIGKLKTQNTMVLNKKQGTSLTNAGDKINKELESRFGEKRIRAKFEGRSEDFINKQVKKGQERIANNTVTVQRG